MIHLYTSNFCLAHVHICEYEITQGGCKRKKSCKFNHSQETDHCFGIERLSKY